VAVEQSVNEQFRSVYSKPDEFGLLRLVTALKKVDRQMVEMARASNQNSGS